ncbi:MAG: SOUL heme-binding protein [Bacteroidetes bacterium]|nr:MAG: SOUL heme-binding protein [Bacteroidota bacterium]PTM13316.1 MAG: SOUL heme-binding protein [Bacteroidota bacterium]
MKTALIVLAILAGVFLIFQIYLSMATNQTETQPYEVVRTEEGFEIRHYPAATLAVITSAATSYKTLGSSGFRKLAGYIFGGNADQQKIAMTAPVHMAITDTTASMAFVMPAAFDPDNLPRPNDADVKIETAPAEYVAALTFGGFATDAKVAAQTEKLRQLLQARGIPYTGNFRLLAYNPPYQLFGRRNEIIVQVALKA